MQYMDDAKRAKIPRHYRCKGCNQPIALHTKVMLQRCFKKIRGELAERLSQRVANP